MKELKLVSSNALIAELYQDFNIAGSEWVHKAKRWVARGIEVMGLSGYFERAILWDTVEEYSVILPCDLRTLGVILVKAVDYSNTINAALPIATSPATNSTDINGNPIEAIYEDNTLVRLPLTSSLIIGKPFMNIPSHTTARGYINNNRLHTTFETGEVLFVYYKVPVDSDGYPLVPDFGLSIEALNYWIIYKMSLGGFKHPVISFDTAYKMWKELYPQARNRINYPSLEEMQSFTRMVNNPIIGDWSNKLYFQ